MMDIEKFGLYLVVTDPVTSYEKCAEAAVTEGVRFLQLRRKPGTREEVLETARNFHSITKGSSTLFIVDDDPEIASESEADGVHLGQSDMPLPEARAKFPALRIFGLSTHNAEQAKNAVDAKPDYCGVGPVFRTPTKKIPDPVVGSEEAGRIIKAMPFPAVAIGGINETNLAQVLQQGAVNFAVVRPVCRSASPRDAIRRLQDIWASALR